MQNKRLLVSLENNILDRIKELAKANDESLSKVAKNLIISSLELEEDLILSKLGDERAASTKEWLNHNDAWK